MSQRTIQSLQEILRSAPFGEWLQARLLKHQAGAPSEPVALWSVALTLPAADTTLLSVLRRLVQTAQPYWYRAEPESGQQWLGWGEAFTVQSEGTGRFGELQSRLGEAFAHWQTTAYGVGDSGTKSDIKLAVSAADTLPSPAAFLGFSFFSSAQGIPADSAFPPALLCVPALLCCQREDRMTVWLTVASPQAFTGRSLCEHWLSSLSCLSDVQHNPAPVTNPSGCSPPAEAGEDWATRMAGALQAIHAGQLEKVVLTRRVFWSTASASIDVPALLARLLIQQPESTVFAVARGGEVFLGASPERLLRIAAGPDGRHLETEALAGTVWKGGQALGDVKNTHEQALVVDAVALAVRPLCTDMRVEAAPQTLQTGHMRHLRSRIDGKLKPEASFFSVVEALHPTPAVGGTPTAAAMNWLQAQGERRDAWYSGGVGRLFPEGGMLVGDVSVAIRTAWLSSAGVLLQAGAGIVAHSDPGQEFAEIEAKLQTLQVALRESQKK